jgi:GNAT superfamily N-acetyltransferase
MLATIGFVCGHDLGFRAYLSELVVVKTRRGQGIGRQLVAHLESELASRGCAILISDVWKDVRGFYESMGWSPPDAVLLRKILNKSHS